MGILSLFRQQKKAEQAVKTREKARGKKDAALASAEKTVPVEETAFAMVPESALLRPLLSEKSVLLGERSQYVFFVRTEATKQDVRRAVEKQFRVRVDRVRMVNIPSKRRRRGLIEGRVSGHRKAIVFLHDGQTIDLTRNLSS